MEHLIIPSINRIIHYSSRPLRCPLVTLLRYWQTRTHCCRHKCFPVCPRAQHLLRTQKMFLILFRNILCPQQMFPSLGAQGNVMSNNVSATMCPRLPPPLVNGETFLFVFKNASHSLSCNDIQHLISVRFESWPVTLCCSRERHFLS